MVKLYEKLHHVYQIYTYYNLPDTISAFYPLRLLIKRAESPTTININDTIEIHSKIAKLLDEEPYYYPGIVVPLLESLPESLLEPPPELPISEHDAPASASSGFKQHFLSLDNLRPS